MFSNNKHLLTPPTPFVTSIEADSALMRRVNTRAKDMQVLVVSLQVSKKKILAFFRQCRPSVLLQDAAKQLKMELVCMSGQTHKSNSA